MILPSRDRLFALVGRSIFIAGPTLWLILKFAFGVHEEWLGLKSRVDILESQYRYFYGDFKPPAQERSHE